MESRKLVFTCTNAHLAKSPMGIRFQVSEPAVAGFVVYFPSMAGSIVSSSIDRDTTSTLGLISNVKSSGRIGRTPGMVDPTMRAVDRLKLSFRFSGILDV